MGHHPSPRARVMAVLCFTTASLWGYFGGHKNTLSLTAAIISSALLISFYVICKAIDYKEKRK